MEIQYHKIEDLEINNTWERYTYRSSDVMCYSYVINSTENVFLSYNAPLESIFFGFSCYPNLDKKLREWCSLRTKNEIRIIKKHFINLSTWGSASHMYDMIIPISKENMVKAYFEAQKQSLGDLSVIKFDLDRISPRQKDLLSIFDPPQAEKLFDVVTDLENSKSSDFSDLLIKDQNMWIRLFLTVRLGLEPPLTHSDVSENLESEIEDIFDRKPVKTNVYAAALTNLLDWPRFYSTVALILENFKEEVTAPKADGSVYSYLGELTRYKKRMEEKYPFLLMKFD